MVLLNIKGHVGVKVGILLFTLIEHLMVEVRYIEGDNVISDHNTSQSSHGLCYPGSAFTVLLLVLLSLTFYLKCIFQSYFILLILRNPSES